MVEQTSKTLYQALWNSADILRSKMDANEYKNYLLGLVFYKYLSDRLLYHTANLLEQEVEDLNAAQKIYEEAFEDAEIKDDLIDNLYIDELILVPLNIYHIQSYLTGVYNSLGRKLLYRGLYPNE